MLHQLADPENLALAARTARKGKSRRPDVEAWWLQREAKLETLAHKLRSQTWRPSPYETFWIKDPKRREITAAPFEDRVVHHALCRIIQPILERSFIARSYSCQIGKGTTAARETCRRRKSSQRQRRDSIQPRATPATPWDCSKQ